MGERAITLKAYPAGLNVPAVIHDALTLDDLFTAEEQWCAHRIGVLRELAAGGHHDLSAGWPESVHWSWASKAASCLPSRLGSSGDVRLFGVEIAGVWQALLFGLRKPRGTRLREVGRPLVYVDFIEVAPWNWDVPVLSKAGQYRGAGTKLMELAVRWSLSLRYQGRLGLHALPQAEPFYRERCRMRNLGTDASYDDLTYLEMSAAGAREFLMEKP